MSRDGGDIVNELRDSKVRLKEERDAAEIRREQAEYAREKAENDGMLAILTTRERLAEAPKEAAQWEDRALTAESALMDLEASLDKKAKA